MCLNGENLAEPLLGESSGTEEDGDAGKSALGLCTEIGEYSTLRVVLIEGGGEAQDATAPGDMIEARA